MRVALLRPYLFVAPSHLMSTEESSWDSDMKQMMISAAAKVTSAFETLISAQLASLLGQGPYVHLFRIGKGFASTNHSASINALTPVAQDYLIHLMSRQEAERRIAQNKFDSCIIILEEMQKVDGYAYAYLRVFKDARRSILSNEGLGLAAPMDFAVTHDQDPAFVDWGEFLWKDWDAALAANWDNLTPVASA